MVPENYRFGGGASSSLIHPLVALAATLVVILILSRPLRNCIAPVLLAIFLIPKGQVLVLAGVHLNVYRIILLAGLARWFISRRSSPLTGGFNSIDRVFTMFALSDFVIFSLRLMNPQALIMSTGQLLDALGGYFIFRFLIRDREDVRTAIKALGLVAIIMGISMLNEQRTRVNVFGLLGGTSPIPETRGGKIRSMAAFLHSIPAGAFGATLVPLLIWLWSDLKLRKVALLGLLGATAMAVTCHSSTVLSCYAAGIFGLCLWPIRKHMRLVRYGLVLTVISLHLIMKGPVWSLLEHIDLTGSSENFHRFALVDTLITHFNEWWLLGTSNNGSWGWEMADTSNEYVYYGVDGGLLTLGLFIALISKCFGRLGIERKAAMGNRNTEWFLWCLGAAMFAHLVVFVGIDYFDQMLFAWLALLAMISTSVSLVNRPQYSRVLEHPVVELAGVMVP
jgi:hypothetical protein